MGEATQKVFLATAAFFQPDRGEFRLQSTPREVQLILPIFALVSIAVFLLQYILSRSLWKDRENDLKQARRHVLLAEARLITDTLGSNSGLQRKIHHTVQSTKTFVCTWSFSSICTQSGGTQ